MIAVRKMCVGVTLCILFLSWKVSGSVTHKPAYKELLDELKDAALKEATETVQFETKIIHKPAAYKEIGSVIHEPVYTEKLEEHLKDAAHKEGAEKVQFDINKGQKEHQVENLISDSHKNLISKNHDEGKFLKKNHNVKSAHESDAYNGHNAKQDKVEESAANGLKRGHKKGHSKQGFQNSYHKDESSSKSVFFDDINDEGDQAQSHSRLNNYDNQGGRSYHGAHKVGQQHELDNYIGKGHDRYDDTGLKQIQHIDHGKNYYLDDRHLHNKYQDDRNIYDRSKVHDRHVYRAPLPPPPPPVHHDPGWDWQRWEDSRRGWDDRGWDRDPGWGRDGFESRPAPAQIPQSAPVLTHRKQTVTIYEDPRYEGNDRGQLRKEEGDYLQLEYKPASHRYASYDDTYYNAVPAREAQTGSMEQSNKLVYNYRRE